MAFKNEYILSVDKFDKKYIEDRDDLANILFDEYSLDYSFVNNANMLKVFIHNDDENIKLKKMIIKYSNDKKYANEVIEETNESIKNIIYNKMENRRFSNRRGMRSSSLRERMETRNESFSRPLRRPTVTSRRLKESFEDRISRRIRAVEESNARPMRFSKRVNESRVANRLSVSRINERNERIARRARMNSINESLVEKLKRDRFSRLNESEDAKKCPTTFEGKKIEKMTKAEKRSAAAQVRKDIKEAQKLLKSREKEGRSTKAIETKIEKLQALLDCLTKREEVKESLRSKFARSRRIFESDEENTDNEDNEEVENTEDDKDNATDSDDNTENEEEFDDVDIKAITLKVYNKNVDKLKDALIEAGVEENDIEVEDNEDAEDDDEVGVKVDVNSFDALKSYCDSVGINLEEELGGDVVSDDESDDTEDADSEEDNEVPADDNDSEEDNDFTDAEIDDIFK